jgi:hypothetical protein
MSKTPIAIKPVIPPPKPAPQGEIVGTQKIKYALETGLKGAEEELQKWVNIEAGNRVTENNATMLLRKVFAKFGAMSESILATIAVMDKPPAEVEIPPPPPVTMESPNR